MGIVSCDIGVSVDGFAAGPSQSREEPLGVGGEDLHRWMFEAPEENREEIDAILGHGAYIMGRNMFGPIRGPWDEPWDGWWGREPPYRAPVSRICWSIPCWQPKTVTSMSMMASAFTQLAVRCWLT